MNVPPSPDPRSAAPSTPEADVLSAVRHATGERHERLDRGMPLGRADADLGALREHLLLLRGWLAALPTLPVLPGAAAESTAPVDPALGAARREQLLGRLDADLADLGVAPAARARSIPVPPGTAPDATAFAWGVAYVVEGAQLGGRALYQRLARRLQPHPLRSLRGDAAAPASAAGDAASTDGAVASAPHRWPAFVQAFRRAVPPGPAVAHAVDGAVWAFDALLTQLAPPRAASTAGTADPLDVRAAAPAPARVARGDGRTAPAGVTGAAR